MWHLNRHHRRKRFTTNRQRTKTITGSVSLNVTTTTIPTDYGAENSTTADSTQFDDVGGNQAAYICNE